MWAGLITALKEVAKDAKKIKDEERKDLAALFEITSDLLLKISTEFEEDRYPHVECATIETLGKNISKHMAKIIGKKRRTEVLDYFKPFHSLKDEWEKRKEDGVLNEIRSAAGEFKGLSLLFKI